MVRSPKQKLKERALGVCSIREKWWLVYPGAVTVTVCAEGGQYRSKQPSVGQHQRQQGQRAISRKLARGQRSAGAREPHSPSLSCSMT